MAPISLRIQPFTTIVYWWISWLLYKHTVTMLDREGCLGGHTGSATHGSFGDILCYDRI